jgi:serine/threonine protein kinase
MVGKIVGKYRILDRIGRGGMGVVYKAVDETLERDVAIKVLNSEVGDAAVLKRFRAEAVTLARLNHPGIATIFELHRQQDELLMVMEYVRGETFHELADRLGPLDPPQAAHLCIQVLDALGYAHHAGVIHRDLKPANLMVTESGTVKVMDFGIARVLGSEHFTHGGLMMGTPAYMAPEQVSGQPIDARADLYSMGVVFYRLIAGRLPFLADTAIAMAQKQLSEVPTPLDEVREGLPEWCTAIVERALAKAPEQRFQTAEEFRLALMSAVVPQSLGELPTLATPAPFPQQIAIRRQNAALESDAIQLPVTPMARERTTPTTTVVLGRMHLFALAAVLLILTTGIVVLGIAAFRSSGQPSAPSGQSASPSASSPVDQKRDTQSTTATSAAVPPPPPPPAPAAASAPPKAAVPELPRQTSSTSTSRPRPSAPPAPVPSVTASSTPAIGSTAASAAEAPSSEARPAATNPAPATVTPAVAFGNVRILFTRGSRLYESRGVLRIADGQISITDGSESKVLVPLSAVTNFSYSRSRHPRWRDADGKEVTGRVDFGRFSFFRGDRNWFILGTQGEPLILSVDDGLVAAFTQAVQTRTGLTLRRFQ